MKKRVASVGIITILAISAWLGFRFGDWGVKSSEESIYSGTLEATMIPVQAEQGGKLVEVLGTEGQAIEVGEVLARMDDRSAKITLESAKAQLEAAQASLDQAEEGGKEYIIAGQKANVDIVKQSVKAAELALKKLEIKSPLKGRVFYRHVEAGQVVGAGTRIITLVNPDDLWVKVYIPETQLGQVRLGGEARLTVDAYPDQEFSGEVSFISNQAEFTPKNVQTREERTKTVYAVKIRVTEGKDVLKAGMPADVLFQ